MFCTECGQPMAEEAKFCAYCGTRKIVPPSREEVAAAQPAASRPEPQTAAASSRPLRSTAEITPIRVQRAAAPPPSEPEAPGVQEDEQSSAAVPWRLEDSPAPPLFRQPEAPPVRPSTPVQAYEPAARAAAEVHAADRYAGVPFAAAPGVPEVATERRKISPVLIGAIIVALIAVAGIVWMVHTSLSGAGKASTPVSITIYPTEAKIAEGKSADFAATVSGAPTSDVTWKVEEGDDLGEIKSRGAYSKEGEISLYCTYTAPKKPGTYHLVATSTADTTKSASAEITVTK